jgi:hypothetical protein
MYEIYLAPLAGSCEHVNKLCFHKRRGIYDQLGYCQLLKRTSIGVVCIVVSCYLQVGARVQRQAGRRRIDFDLSIHVM